MKTNTKTLAISLSLLASTNVLAGMGGLNVQSNLGEPFSGSITVTGKEAEALLQSRSVNVSGGGVSGTVVPQGNGNVVIRLRSSAAVHEPVLNFVVKAGNQTRQYTAMINPARYAPQTKARTNTATQSAQRNMEDTSFDGEDVAQPTKKARPQRQRTAPMARSSNAVYHRVQTGETLAQIAANYRPHNMSQQRAMRAIMAANPRAFRRGTNGNILYDGSTLYIPTASQFQGYASSKKRQAQRRLSSRHYVAPATTIAATDNNAATPAMPQPAPTTQPTPTTAQPAPINQAPVATPSPTVAPEAPKPAVASTPTTVASTPNVASTTSTMVAPSAPASAVAPVMASETVVASAASTPALSASSASMVAASAASAAPISTAAPAPRVRPVQEPEPEPETDWMPLALGGVAGLAILGGAGYLLSRRRKAATEEANEEEFVVAEDDDFVIEETSDVSPAVAAAQRVNLGKQAEEAQFNTQDDEVFFEETNTVSSKNATNEFDLDNFEPEETFSAKQVANEQTDEEWDWLNEETNTSEDSNWNGGKTAAVAATAAVAGTIIASHDNETPEFDEQEFDVAPAAPIEETSSDDDWLNEIFSENAAEPPLSSEQAALDTEELVFEQLDTQAADTTVETETALNNASEFDLDFDTETPAAPAVAAVSPVIAASQEDDLTFDLADDLSLPENEITATEAATIADDVSFDLPAEPEADISFELDDIATPEPDSFELPSEEVVDFNQEFPATKEVAAPLEANLVSDDFAIEPADTPVADSNFAIEEPAAGISIDFNNEVATLAATEEAAESNNLDAAEIAFADNSALDSISNLADIPAPSVAESAAEDLSWMNEVPAEAVVPAINEANAAGFVSEAVGMAAPQEAKFELAKMYLEIDDAVAARETLRELINESSGDLQQQAKALLEELGN